MAPRLLGADGRPLANLIGPQRLADSPEWRIHDLRQIGPDIRIMLRPNR
jgi:diaminohydroxyphosphoribosylaminopyrimidine deaminase/5-amino-6-(5-phosphoribosylamino)uracil reductase